MSVWKSRPRLRRSRLVTLTGPGGIGKTRLALEVAAEVSGEFDDGVCLVALESLLDGTMVARQIAIQFGLKEEAARSCLAIVTEHLHAKRLLLVLDNCEHLLEDAARVAGHLLRECAGVRVLATSREALGITGETAWVVPALAVPDPAYLPDGQATLVRVLLGYESVQLFIERAQAVQQSFALTANNARTVAEVCARLEGIPLAIEFAAARVKAMTVEQIAARLGDHLGLLTGGSRASGLSRQQTLRATLDWSYDLLSELERLLLRRLSVFAGGWSLDAAERVCAGGSIAAGQVLDLLTSLVDKSLVMFKVQGADAGGRYRLLETVRQYAAESLYAKGESEQVRARHTSWYLDFAEEAALRLGSPEQGEWLGRLEMEHDNLRVSLARMISDPAGAEANLRLTAALAQFWQIRGYSGEGRRHLEQALAREEAPVKTAARGKALSGSASLAYTQGDFASSKTRYEESLRLFKGLEDKAGSAEALTRLGTLAQSQGDYTAAKALHEEGLGLFRDAGDRRGVAQTLGSLGNIVRQQGNFPSARELIQESLSLFRELGDWVSAARALNNLGNIVRLQGDYVSAKTLYEEGLSLRTEMGDKPGIAWSLSGLGALAYVQENFAEARRLHEESLKIRREFGSRQGIAWSLNNLGLVAQSQGRMEAAGVLHRESLTLFNELGDKMGSAWSINHLGLVARSEGEEASARILLEESLTLFTQLGDTEGMATGLKELAAVLAAQSHIPKAARLWGAAQSLRESIGAPLPANLQAKYHQEIAQANVSLDKGTFAALWEEGRALTWEQASAYALTDTANIPPAN